MRSLRLLVLGLLAVLLAGCPAAEAPSTQSHLEAARSAAKGSRDPDRLGAWLLAELIAPEGDSKQAAKARAQLAELEPGALEKGGLLAALARAFDHDVHGRFEQAGHAYVKALSLARQSDRDEAPLVGWFVAHRLGAVQAAVDDLWKEAEPIVEAALERPGGLGWRARGVLVEWWSRERIQRRGEAGDVLDEVRQQHGCLNNALMAGPFGHGALGDHRVHFPAEAPAPWPARFPPDPRRGQVPRVLQTESTACVLRPAEVAGRGVYYVQTFLDLDAPRDVIVAVQGAYALFVDDQLVLERDMADWGVWPRFGVRMRLEAGRHRILGRLIQPNTSVRVLSPTGAPLGLEGSAEQGAPYAMTRPALLEDPNVLEPFVRAAGVEPLRPVSAPALQIDHPVHRYLGAYLAHVEGQDDLASVIFEPLVEEVGDATPAALAQQAVFVDGDPIYDEGVARDLARDLRQKAADADPQLWGPKLWLVLERADKERPSELVADMEKLAERFGQVPAVLSRLAAIYGQLGWKAERLATLEKAAKRFPKDVSILEALLETYEEQGKLQEADALAERIEALDPYAEVVFRRALARRDYAAAIAELKRLGKLESDRREIAFRIADLLVRAGKDQESLAKLELALEKEPSDASARLALADARFARGDERALTDALVEAIRTGADDAGLRYAIELTEGMTDFEPYRRDGASFIDALESSGEKLPGSAARVLDYGAVWVAPDGSARMLEHEIIRVQSREGIERHAEQPIPRGVLLRLRTIKADGSIYEPEIVAGKPTVTMPHLEVGDYIETESIWMLGGASEAGRRFLAPRWYFREENTSYHTSEFVVILPRHIDEAHELIVETTGEVPEAKVERSAGLVVRKWRVDESLALVEEPLRPPIQEFLPSVRVGWGIDANDQLERVRDAQRQDVVRDPRMVRIAETIVSGKLTDEGSSPREQGSLADDDKARRIYRWVLDTIEPGKETAGPRIITSKSGQPAQAFLYLCRLLRLDARLALVRDRLAPPPKGPISKAELYSAPAIRVKHRGGTRWLVVGERYAPYGFVPSSIRGQPAVMIQPEGRITTVASPPLERDVTSSAGADDGVTHRGTMTLAANGSATLDLTQTYAGRYAIGLRSALSKVLESRRKDVIEAQLLGLALPGGRIAELALPNLDELDEPVTLQMDVEVPTMARLAAGELVFEVPFLGSLSQLVRLPDRETPLYISERTATAVRVELRVRLPEGAEVVTPLRDVTVEEPDLTAVVNDRLEGDELVIERRGRLPAGRVQPEDYQGFRERVLQADAALNRKLRIRL